VDGTLCLIDRWSSELHQRGIGISIIMIPAVGDQKPVAKEQYRLFEQRLKDNSSQFGFTVIDLNTGYPQAQTNSFDGVLLGHFNVLGHQVVADRLLPHLEELWDQRH